MRPKKQYLLVQPNPDDTQLPAKIVRNGRKDFILPSAAVLPFNSEAPSFTVEKSKFLLESVARRETSVCVQSNFHYFRSL